MLITLAIIGIIAALTIPNIIQDYKKIEVETKLKKFYSYINQSIELSETDNGNKELWEYKSKEDFYNKYLKNYIQTTETEEISANSMRVTFKDGTAMLLELKSNGCEITFCLIPSECDNTNTYENNKRFGTRAFSFGFFPGQAQNSNYKHHYQKGVEPYRVFFNSNNFYDAPYTSGTTSHLNCNPNSDSNGKRMYCTAVIQHNNWKIPKDYPFKFY